MAGAGNIILNTARGPYRVRQQPRLFAQQQQQGSGLQTANDVMSTIEHASKIANMVAPFINTENKAATQFAESRGDAESAMADVQSMQAQPGQAPQGAPQTPYNPETHQYQQEDFNAAQQAMQQAQQMRGTEALGMQNARMGLAAENQPQPGVFRQGFQEGVPQLQVEPISPFSGVNPQAIMQGMGTEGLAPQQGIGAQTGQMPQPTQQQRPEAPQLDPQGMQVLRDTQMHPDQEPLSFSTSVEAQTAMQQAAAAGDIEGYNQAVDAMQRSNLTDVRPQKWQDLITGDHHRRAQQGIMKAFPAPKAPSALDNMRLKKMQTDIEDKMFKQVMSVQKDDRAEMLAQLTAKLNRARLPGIKSDAITKGVVAKMKEKDIKSSIRSRNASANAANARAANTREDTRVDKATRPDRIAKRQNQTITSGPGYKAEVKEQDDLNKRDAANKADKRKVDAAVISSAASDKRSKGYATRRGKASQAQGALDRLHTKRIDLVTKLERAKSSLKSLERKGKNGEVKRDTKGNKQYRTGYKKYQAEVRAMEAGISETDERIAVKESHRDNDAPKKD